MELTQNSIPYEVGIARCRGSWLSARSPGLLRHVQVCLSTEDLKLLSVHIFVTNATEIMHIEQALMGCGDTVEYRVDTVFNCPRFSETYKNTALEVINKMCALNQFRR